MKNIRQVALLKLDCCTWTVLDQTQNSEQEEKINKNYLKTQWIKYFHFHGASRCVRVLVYLVYGM